MRASRPVIVGALLAALAAGPCSAQPGAILRDGRLFLHGPYCGELLAQAAALRQWKERLPLNSSAANRNDPRMDSLRVASHIVAGQCGG